jgi:hypothetical protein
MAEPASRVASSLGSDTGDIDRISALSRFGEGLQTANSKRGPIYAILR